MKPRDPDASVRVALREVTCPRCNGHGRPRIAGSAEVMESLRGLGANLSDFAPRSEKRIDKWLSTYAGAESSPYTDAVGALVHGQFFIMAFVAHRLPDVIRRPQLSNPSQTRWPRSARNKRTSKSSLLKFKTPPPLPLR